MIEEERISAIRRELPSTTNHVYLNTGSCGPLPRRSLAAAHAQDDRELSQGRIVMADFEQLLAAIDELRDRFARLLGAEANEIALTHHTTDGMNIGIWGLNWQPGDELVTTNNEHQGGVVPAYLAGQRRGLTVRVVDIGAGDGDVVGRLERAITRRTRLLSLSHVSWMSGEQLPLADIVEMAHRHDVLVLVDGAQSAGAIPVDLHRLGVDMYAVPGQKWLCGPEGIGAFYVRRERIAEVSPTFGGYLSLASGTHMDYAGTMQLAPGARRYEVGSAHRPSLFAMRESLRWLEDEVGWPWIHDRIPRLARQTAQWLAELPGIRVVTPASRAGLTSFTVDGMAPEEVVLKLAERQILIRSLPFVNWLRVSTGFYNTEDDLIRLRDALAEIAGA